MSRTVLIPVGLALLCAACASPQPEPLAAADPSPLKAPRPPRVEKTRSDTVRQQARSEFEAYLQCALRNAGRLAASPEPAEQVARAAMAGCVPEQQAFTLAIARASDQPFANRLWETTQPDIRQILVRHVVERRRSAAGPGRASRPDAPDT